MLMSVQPNPPTSPVDGSIDPAAVAALVADISRKVTDAGLKREDTTVFYVVAMVVIVGAVVAVLLLLKLRKDAREDRKQAAELEAQKREQDRLDEERREKFRLEELDRKIQIEDRRLKQTAEMTSGADRIAEAAACHERTAVLTNRNLELSDKHVTSLMQLGEQRKCKAGD